MRGKTKAKSVEYLVVASYGNTTAEEISSMLNANAERGWELVTVDLHGNYVLERRAESDRREQKRA